MSEKINIIEGANRSSCEDIIRVYRIHYEILRDKCVKIEKTLEKWFDYSKFELYTMIKEILGLTEGVEKEVGKGLLEDE